MVAVAFDDAARSARERLCARCRCGERRNNVLGVVLEELGLLLRRQQRGIVDQLAALDRREALLERELVDADAELQ